MPLYEYKCRKCGHQFEMIETVTAADVKKCPKCGAKAERMLVAPAIQFKGSGWYVTDYAGKSSSKGPGEASGDGDSAKPAEKGSEKPAETKPAAEKTTAKKKK